MGVVKEVFLHNTESGSDKVYISRVIERSSGMFVHQTSWGKRGGNLRVDSTTASGEYPTTVAHEQCVLQKQNKGYNIVSANTINQVASVEEIKDATIQEESKILVDNNTLISSKQYLLQRRPLGNRFHIGASNYTFDYLDDSGFNIPRDKVVLLADIFTSSITKICRATNTILKIQGIITKNNLYIDDIGGNYKDLPLEKRLLCLKNLFEVKLKDTPNIIGIKLVPTAFTYSEKMNMIHTDSDGLVFRKIDEIYSCNPDRFYTLA